MQIYVILFRKVNIRSLIQWPLILFLIANEVIMRIASKEEEVLRKYLALYSLSISPVIEPFVACITQILVNLIGENLDNINDYGLMDLIRFG